MIKPHQCILGLGKKSCVFPGCGFPAWHGHDHKAMASRFTDDGSSLLFLSCFPGCGFPAWHVHDHKSMALRFTDDGSVFFLLSLGCFAGCCFLWLPPLNMMGITLTLFGLISRIWFPSLALAMTTNLWHPILDMMDTTLIIFGLIFRMWFSN